MKKSDIATVLLFYGTIATVFVLNIITPDREFSDAENRTLQGIPKITFNNLLSGKLSSEVEDYVTDQFIYRDTFIEMKSNTEFLLGKQENNNVFLTGSNTLIERFTQPDYESLDRSIDGIKAFKESVEVPVYTMIIPTQSEVHEDLLPKNAPTYKQETLINYVYGKLEDTVNVYDILKSHRQEYIFYNTDHHWTSRGAYYGYTALMEVLGRDVLELTAFEEKLAVTNFNGTIYNKSGIKKASSDTIYTYTENQEIQVNTGSEVVRKMLYDESYLGQVDKYALFLGGNDPVVMIEGVGEGSILLVKDSYTNSMAPFLLKQFKEVHLIDLRFMRQAVSEYVIEHEIDEVVICYSTGNFAEDKNIQLIK